MIMEIEIGKILISSDGIIKLELDIPYIDNEISSQLEEANQIIANVISKSFDNMDK